MKNKLKFYFKENKYLLSFISLVLISQTILTLFILYVNKAAINDPRILNSKYEFLIDNWYIELLSNTITCIVIFICALSIGSSTISNFPKARRYKASMGDMRFIEYFANPILIILACICLLLSVNISEFLFWLSPAEKMSVFETLSFNKQYVMFMSNFKQIFITSILISFLVYFGLLILYKQLSSYTIKYRSMKYKIVFTTLHFIAGFIIIIGLFYLYEQIIFDVNIGMYNSETFYFYDEAYDRIGMYSTIYRVLASFTVLSVIVAFYSKCRKLDSNKPSGKLRYIIYCSLLVLLIAFPSLTQKYIYDSESKQIKDITGAQSLVNVDVSNFTSKDYDEIDKELQAILKENNITDYYIEISNVVTQKSVQSEFMYQINNGKNVGVVVGDYKQFDGFEYIIGDPPKDFTEIVISDDYAKYIFDVTNYSSYEELIGKEIEGYIVVGIFEADDTNYSKRVKKYYYGEQDADLYRVYSNKDFNEDVFKKFSQGKTEESVEVIDLNDESSYEYSEGTYSFAFLTIYVLNTDTEYEEDNMYKDNYKYTDEFSVTIMYHTDFNDYGLLFDYILYLVIATTLFIISTLYITSNKERRGKNV